MGPVKSGLRRHRLRSADRAGRIRGDRIMGKYDPLRRHLAAVPDDRREIGLSLREVESLVGTLPPSARGYRAWWGNHGTSPQAAAWLDAGFVVERVDLTGEQVAFVRPPGAGGSSSYAGLPEYRPQ